MAIRSTVETITPKKARLFLQNMAPNRPLNEWHAKRLASVMTDGKWKLNGEAIILNDKGQMEDGQHTCQAVIISGTEIEKVVTRGVASNSGTFESLGSGRRRTIADMFARAKEENYAMLASAAAWLWRYEHGHIANRYMMVPRHDEALAVLEKHPGLRRSCQAAHKVQKILRPSVAVFLHYIFSNKDIALADKFFQLLGSGENISSGSTDTSGIYAIRARLINNRDSKAKLPVVEIIPLVIKAWNATRQRKVVRTLRFGCDENYPTVE
jgi:hypothetical protein